MSRFLLPRWFALGLAACAPAAPDLADSPLLPGAPLSLGFDLAHPVEIPSALRARLERVPLSAHDQPLPRGAPTHRRVPDLMQGAFPHLRGELVMTRGAELVERIEALPFERRQLGLQAMTAEELFGLDGDRPLCREPRIRSTFRHDGTPWEAELNVPTVLAMTDVLDPDVSVLDPACIDALDTEAFEQAIEDEACAGGLEHHFWSGTACRSCLEGGDTWGTCADQDHCHSEAPVHWRTRLSGLPLADYGTVQARMLACAPDLMTGVVLLYHLDDARPVELEAFDYDRWAAMCLPVWSDGAWDVTLVCNQGNLAGHGDLLGAGVLGRAHAVRPRSEERPLHQGRMWYAPTVEVAPGVVLEATWLDHGTLGNVASPAPVLDMDQDGDIDVIDALESPWQGWGLEPYRLRPDGTDPDSLDDTFARDFLGAIAIKTATRYDGVPIVPFIYNRCADGAWVSLPDGRSRCTALGPHHLDPPLVEDAASDAWLTDDGRAASVRLPVTTLVSTGLPDRTVPGDVLIDIKGSTALAKTGWEACTWPQQFAPDLTVLDERPYQGGPPAPMVAQTYRFGREAPGEDRVRVGLNTATVRDFCPEFPE